MPTMTVTMNPSLDLSTTTERVAPGRKVRCGETRRDPGGGGVNVARVMRRLGGSVQAVLPLGGPTGDRIERLLRGEAIDHRIVPLGGETRTDFAVLDTSTSEQYRFVTPGPELAEHEWRAVLDVVARATPFPRYVVASGSLPRGVPDDFYAWLSWIVDDRGGRFVLDASGEPLRRAVQDGRVFLVKPNVRELGQLLDVDVHEHRQFDDLVCRPVDDDLVEVVVLSLGAGGALVAMRDRPVQSVPAPTVPITSRTGAGDSMVGALVEALDAGATLHDAARRGVAAGAAAVTTPGSQLCRAADVEALLPQVEAGAVSVP